MFNEIVAKLSTRLIFKQRQLVTVESCTGGWIGKAMTDMPGSSAWFAGGLILYSNHSKTRLVGVTDEQIKQYGAVSLQVAQQMAIGALEYFANAVSVAVTGIAGPEGGSAEKPVGTVCIATCMQAAGKNLTNAKCYQFDGDRKQVREQSVEQALLMVMRELN